MVLLVQLRIVQSRFFHRMLSCIFAMCIGLASLGAGAQEIDIKAFKNCPKESESTSALVLLNSRVNLIQGWSHAAQHPEQFSLAQTPEHYAVDHSRWNSQSDCRDSKTYQTILVKKMGDWSQNHVNGLEPMLDRAQLTFGDVSALQITFRINRKDTHLPQTSAIKEAFSFAADADALAQLDHANVTLGLTFFGLHFADQNLKTPNANYLLTIPPRQFNNWLTVTLPISNMQFFWEQNYAPTFAKHSELAAETILGLRITPETDTGRVARSLNPNAWETPRPELFKEMAVEFREILVLTR